MKRLLGFVLLFSFMLVLPAHAETLTHGTLEYEVTKEKEIRILGYSDEAIAQWQESAATASYRDLTIPDEIGGLLVTEVADYAFYLNGEAPKYNKAPWS